MAKFSPSRLKQKPFLLATSLFALSGWGVAFTGACMLKVLNGAWWIIIYQLFIVLGHIAVFACGSIQQYKVAMVTFLASSIPLLTIQVDYVIQYTKPGISKTAATAYVAGYVVILTIQYAWVLVIGSDSSTFLGKLGQVPNSESGPHDNRDSFEPEFYSEKLNEARLSHPSTANIIMNAAAAAVSTNPTPSSIKLNILNPNETLMFKERAQALHSYMASQNDPSELSFEKGEILEIAQKSGNWLQARNSKGEIGIVPANYVKYL